MKKTLQNLTDKQFLDLLQKIRADLDSITEVDEDDCTMTGNKYTHCNVGICAREDSGAGWMKDKYTTLETSIWPKDFKKQFNKPKDDRGREYIYPQMFARKNRGSDHKCPLDGRKSKGNLGWNHSCFYSCMIFQKAKSDRPNLEEIKGLYDKEIEKWMLKISQQKS